MKLQQSIAALLIAVAAAACHAGGAATAAAAACTPPELATPPARSTSAGGSAATADAACDPDAAAMRAQAAYHDALHDLLAQSADPRDWALATLVHAFGSRIAPQQRDRADDALLGRALAATPDDALVSWIALERSGRGRAAWRSAALQRLRTQEPDNAAVWLEILTDAARRDDAAGVDAALARMAASGTFDGHFADLLNAVAGAFRRLPAPDAIVAQSTVKHAPPSADTAPIAAAFALTAAAALPAFQPLVNACRVDPANGRHRDRARDCAAAGRIMAAHADTLIASRIGPAVLRVAQTYTDDDVRAARSIDWAYSHYLAMIPTDEADPAFPAQIAVYFADWVDTGSEVEAMRRAALRAGVAADPPAHWIDRYSPFSAERLDSDRSAAAVSAAN
jgi:hypothetical protein